jgi:hypothetical protein
VAEVILHGKTAVKQCSGDDDDKRWCGGDGDKRWRVKMTNRVPVYLCDLFFTCGSFIFLISTIEFSHATCLTSLRQTEKLDMFTTGAYPDSPRRQFIF